MGLDKFVPSLPMFREMPSISVVKKDLSKHVKRMLALKMENQEVAVNCAKRSLKSLCNKCSTCLPIQSETWQHCLCLRKETEDMDIRIFSY